MMRKVIYIDIDTYPREGFTSGLFITVREILKRLSLYKFDPHLVSFSGSKDENIKKIIKKKDGLTIIEFFFPKTIFYNDPLQMKYNIRNILKVEFSLDDIFILSTPAIFLNPVLLEVLKTLKDRKSNAKIIAFDELFPDKKGGVNMRQLNKYFKLLKHFEIYAVSSKIKKKLSALISKKVRYFPNIFNLKKIQVDKKYSVREYVVMINTHPIKGVDIFNEIAKRMTNVKFMIVESWVDVPKYTAVSKNIKHKRFTKNIKDIYKKTKILFVPSLCQEGPARVIIEAAINGIPVLANKIGSIPENGKIVQLVQPPKICGYFNKDSVLFPIVDKVELMKCAESYVEKIFEILDNKNFNHFSKVTKNLAMKKICNSNGLFDKIVRKW